MRKYFIVAGALVALAIPSAALADVSTNGTTNDGYGYCIANHLANFNGDFQGVGHVRSTQTGKVTVRPGGQPRAGLLRHHAGRLRADQQQQQLSSTTDTRNGGWLRLAPEPA